MKISQAVVKSLSIIKRGPATPKSFANCYFPADYPGWRRSGRCGRNANGAQRAQGLYLWSGGWLAKLKRAELLRYDFDDRKYSLSKKGMALLEEHNKIGNQETE